MTNLPSNSFLFESLSGPEVLAETSVMGFDPKIIFKGYSGTVFYPFKWRLKETASTIMDVLRMNDFLVCAEGDVFPDGAIINADSKLLDKQIDEYKKKSNSKNQEASIM